MIVSRCTAQLWIIIIIIIIIISLLVWVSSVFTTRPCTGCEMPVSWRDWKFLVQFLVPAVLYPIIKVSNPYRWFIQPYIAKGSLHGVNAAGAWSILSSCDNIKNAWSYNSKTYYSLYLLFLSLITLIVIILFIIIYRYAATTIL